jgi:hypothetical protein
MAYFNSGKPEAALSDFTEVIHSGRKEDLHNVYYHRGLCYLILGGYSSYPDEKKLTCAVAEFHKAIALRDNDQYHEKCDVAYSRLQQLGIGDVPSCSEPNPGWVMQQVCEDQNIK